MEAKDFTDKLEALKNDLDKAFSQKMKDGIQKDIADLETRMSKAAEEKAALLEKSVTETNDKLAKVITAQDDMLKMQNDAKLNAQTNEQKSFRQLLSEGLDDNTDQMAKFIKGETKSFAFQLKAAGDMGFAANFGTAARSVSSLRPGIITDPNRKVHIRDIVPTGTMDGSTYFYVAENGRGEGNPAPVAENAWKEQMDFDLQEKSANAEYIAGWVRTSKKMLADVNGFRAFLDSRMYEKLLNAEDKALLYGTGATPDVDGIIGTNEYQAYNGGGTVDVEMLILAISQLEDGFERDANGILIRPRNYYQMALNKAVGSGEYDQPGLVSFGADGTMRVAGVPVYASTAMQSDKFLVGDWRMGSLLLQREAPVIEVFYEDGDNVRKNQVTIRIEERIAHAIYGNTYYVYGDFGNS